MGEGGGVEGEGWGKGEGIERRNQLIYLISSRKVFPMDHCIVVNNTEQTVYTVQSELYMFLYTHAQCTPCVQLCAYRCSANPPEPL